MSGGAWFDRKTHDFGRDEAPKRCRLVEGEAPVPELQALTGLSASALSQHLAVLRALDIVATRRQAQSIHYRMIEGPALGVLQALHAAYCGGPAC